MAGAATDESGAGRSFEGAGGQLQQQTCQAGEALAEWRSSEQVENGTPSTSPPYWDSDDDDDGGPKPSELFGKHSWKIEKFSQISKRELRSTPFDIGGYKWYILIYPQGCDVCNHLSLFLCVANHDKLLPGWSHFAQFTICVVNKDPKKSKHSDTLHRFWKKEHDWGWKKFMELSKLAEGFVDADNLTIKAQVQVIHERADRPFRCLDCAYRRELVRVYLTNVEQICRRFVEERRVKLGKLIDDKAKWSSFSAFWRGMDQSSKRRMSQEKTDSILKIVVKHFFIEKEVTSTLVMDSLYSGLRALEGHQKGKMSKSLCLNTEESAGPIVRIDKDMFILVDDVLPLLERVAMEPLPPKDDKGPQNRTKDTVAGEDFNKESIEHDERRLTELGRRTLEIFILAHIFSKIEVSYQEAVALKRQEELIREEEEAWLAEIEQKARRAADKEKKSKKKQGKQKRNNRKGKDKGRDDNASGIGEGKTELDSPTADQKEPVTPDPEMVPEKSDAVEDASDVSDSVEGVPETLPADSDDRDASPVNWDTDASEVHPPTEASSSGISGLSSVQNGRSSSVLDDSSSSCSSDSVPFVAVSASQRGNSQHKNTQKSPRRSRNHPSKTSNFSPSANFSPSRPSEAIPDADAPRSSKAVASTAQAADCSFPQRVVNGAQQNVPEKLRVEENGSSKRNSGSVEVSGDRTARVISPPLNSLGNISPITNPESKASAVNGPPTVKKQSSNSPKQADRPVRSPNLAEKPATPKPDTPRLATPKPITKPSGHVGSEKSPAQQPASTSDKPSTPTPVMSRPLSAPLIPGTPKHPVSVALPTLQSGLTLSRSVSAVGRLGLEPTQSSIPQSYRNVILGNSGSGNLPVAPNHSVSSAVNVSAPYSQAPPALVSAPLRPDRMDPNQNNIIPSFSFGMMNRPENIPNRPDKLPNRPWMEFPDRNLSGNRGSLMNDFQSFDIYDPVHSRSQDPFRFPASTSTRQSHGFPDEFPHLDIINDLLEDEQGVRNSTTSSSSGHRIFSNGHDFVNQQQPFSFNDPGISNGPGLFDRARSPLDDGLQHSYVPSRASYDMIPQASPRSYMNGPRTDGLFPNQWHIPGSDPPFPNSNGYPYHIPEYRNLNTGANYTVFRPSNGH